MGAAAGCAEHPLQPKCDARQVQMSASRAGTDSEHVFPATVVPPVGRGAVQLHGHRLVPGFGAICHHAAVAQAPARARGSDAADLREHQCHAGRAWDAAACGNGGGCHDPGRPAIEEEPGESVGPRDVPDKEV